MRTTSRASNLQAIAPSNIGDFLDPREEIFDAVEQSYSPLTSIRGGYLEQSLAHLRELTKRGDCKIPESAYRPLGVLHLTIGVMTLNPQQLESALQLLQDTDLDALLKWVEDRPKTTFPSSISTSMTDTTGISRAGKDTGTTPHLPVPESLHGSVSLHPSVSPTATIPSNPAPLTISLLGLSAFPEVRKATVLHARPYDSTHRLYMFALALRQNFLDAGFMSPEDRPLVLHATVVNTVYSKSKRERDGESGHGKGRISIDARELMRNFNGREGREDERVNEDRPSAFVWAEEVCISRVRICGMGAKEVEDKGLRMEYQVFGEKHFRFMRDVSC